MGCGKSGGDSAALARQQEADRQKQVTAAIGNINQTFGGFDDNFYNQRAQAYQNYALPQFGDQYRQTQKSLAYKLANQGLLSSSSARDLSNSLAKEKATQVRGIADSGLNQANQLRQNVAQQQNTLINQAQLASDPSSIASSALTSAASLQTPSTFAPVSNFLSNWAQLHLANQLANAYSSPTIAYNNPSNYTSTTPISRSIQ